MKKTYKTDYILKNFSRGEIQKLTGVPAFVTSRLQRGYKPKGGTSAKLKYLYNRSMKKGLKESGIPLDKARYLVRNFEADIIEKEKLLHKDIAKIILRNKLKKYPGTTLDDILEGMSKSFRQDIGDWIAYIKEKKYK
jgi:hypothetical protein